MRTFSIGEVSVITNISRDRIRNYEKKGIISPLRNAENDYRLYTEHDIAVLQAVEIYRFADFGIDEISSICIDSSVDDVIYKTMQKRNDIDTQISRLQELRKRNADIEDKCIKIKNNLNICSVCDFEEFEIIGELQDYTSFEEYSRIYSADGTDKPVMYKIQRMISFSNNMVTDNKMVITKKCNNFCKTKCVYTIVEDGENAENTMNRTFEKCLRFCAENGLETYGKVYVGMLLLLCESKKIISYLEIKAPIK